MGRTVNSKAESVSDKKRKAALYIRVSTDAQYEEGYSVEAQKKKLEQWCAMKDIEQYEFYIDGGFSGSNLDRPEIKRMIDDIKNELVECVVVYKLDRLSRSQKDTIYLLEDVLLPYGVGFVSLNENFDTSTPYGKAMIGILSVFAQLERENIRERTRMGMYERVKSGLWRGGGNPPLGYDYKNGELIPNDKAEDVRQIFKLYASGYSGTQIAKMFGIKSDTQIYNILERDTYIGNMKYNGETLKGNHEPIISEELWNAVQEERGKRNHAHITQSEYLLTGLLFCGKCGARMRYQKWGKDGLKIYCYSQQTNKLNMIKDPDCDNEKLNACEVEEAVIHDLFRVCDERAKENKQVNSRDSNLNILNIQYKATAEKIKRLYNLYANDGNEILLETINELKSQLLVLQEKIEAEGNIEKAKLEIATKRNEVKDLKALWKNMNISERKKAVRLYISRVEITDGNIDIKYLI